MQTYDVIVLGGGAAGLMCAARAASGGCRVLVLEHNDRPGKKIRISGGGRCNFTNRVVTHRNFLSQNPDFARSALARYGPEDFIELVESYGIAWHEKTLGQLFCDGSAQQIIDMLLSECERAAGVTFAYRSRVKHCTHNGVFTVSYEVDGKATSVQARSVVVATGGQSIPTLGASDIGYRIAKHFDHPMIEPLPALVPLTFSSDFTSRIGVLSGVSLEAEVQTSQVTFRESMLFTHRGLSGPSVLQISSYLRDESTIEVDLLPGVPADAVIADYPAERRHLRRVLAENLPQRLLEVWESPLLDKPVNASSRRDIEAFIGSMKSWRITPNGTEGYAKAEVTSGGVCTSKLSSKTMESTIQSGLYFIGEVVDVTGWLGGYNFQWAWSSAVAAADHLIKTQVA
ncbi:MAG: NAD(P)/FAD-dependent oxidoreductase [Candidatus Kapaibacterium sp.]